MLSNKQKISEQPIQKYIPKMCLPSTLTREIALAEQKNVLGFGQYNTIYYSAWKSHMTMYYYRYIDNNKK